MSSNKPHYFAIGLFVLIATVLGIAGVLVFGADRMSSPKYFVETYLDESAAGVDVGTPIRFRGVKVGSVTEVTLTSLEYETQKSYILIRSALDPKVVKAESDIIGRIEQSVGEKGLRVKLVSQGITGLSYLEMDYDPEVAADRLPIDWKPRYCVVPSAPSMMHKVSKTIDRLTTQLDRIDIAAIGLHAQGVVSNLEVASVELRQFIVRLDQVDVEGIGSNVESMVVSLNDAAIDVKRIAETASGEILSDVGAAAADLPSVTSNLVTSSEYLNSILSASDYKIDRILLNLNYTLEDIHELVRMVKRYPGVLLREPPTEKLRPGGKK